MTINKCCSEMLKNGIYSVVWIEIGAKLKFPVLTKNFCSENPGILESVIYWWPSSNYWLVPELQHRRRKCSLWRDKQFPASIDWSLRGSASLIISLIIDIFLPVTLLPSDFYSLSLSLSVASRLWTPELACCRKLMLRNNFTWFSCTG